MAYKNNFALCNRARRNLDDFYAERNAQRNEISKLEERIAVREGEIDEAENLLSSLAEAAENVGDSVLAVGVDVVAKDVPGAARDGVVAAVKLSSEVARQRQKLADLKRRLANETWQLQAARNKLEIIDRDIRQAISILDANNCR
jgi:hypothetical protein